MSPSLFSSSSHPPNAEIPKESALCPDIFLPHPPLLSLQTSPLKMMPITLSGCLHSISHRNATGTLNLGSPKPIHSPPKPTAFLHSLSWRKMSSSALAANLASVFFFNFSLLFTSYKQQVTSFYFSAKSLFLSILSFHCQCS